MTSIMRGSPALTDRELARSGRVHIHVGTTADGIPAMACGIKGSQYASIPLWGGKRDADTCRLCVARSRRFIVPRKEAAHV